MSGQTHPLQIVLVTTAGKTAEAYSQALTSVGHTVSTVASTQEARAALRRDACDVLVTDAGVEQDADGVSFAEEVLAMPTRPQVIVLADKPSVRDAVALTKSGAFDYLAGPVSPDKLRSMVAKVAETFVEHEEEDGFDDFLRAFMVSSVPAVQEMAAQCRSAAARGDATALIVGETGAGKGVVSRIIHWLSAQSRAPFVRINLVDIDPEEVERRLFGTGAGDDGLLAAASGGTLLLREFSDVQPELQDRLRMLLETRVYWPVYGTTQRRFSGRLLATSTLTADELVSEAAIDAGLVYRLAMVTIRVPPLRERADDLARITDALLAQVADDASRPNLHLSGGARQLVHEHAWSGNLRELRNVLTRLALLCPTDEIDSDALARALGFPSAEARRAHKSGVRNRVRTTTRRPRNSSVPVPRLSGLVATALDEPARAERERIEGALEATDGHRERAAAVLGMSRTTLWTRMRMLGIDYERFRRPKAI